MSKQIKILVLFGHGGNDAGAVSNGLIERDMNVVTGRELAEGLRRSGFYVVEDKLDTKVADEIALVKAGTYDLVISVHYNAGRGDGFECYYWSTSESALALCRSIEAQVKSIGQNSRGCKSGDHLAIIKNVKPQSILLEGGFIDNSTDNKLFDTEAEQKALGAAYAKGVCKYFNVEYKESTEPLYRVFSNGKRISNNCTMKWIPAVIEEELKNNPTHINIERM